MTPEPLREGVLIPLTAGRPDRRTFFRALGPAFLVAVGYMDPGNWATDLAAGSRYGFQLLWVVALSSLMALLLQTLCCRLGIAMGMDLAQACRQQLPAFWRWPLWVLAEVAIVACDLAELMGSAIALQLLFGLPLPWGVLLTAVDTVLLLSLQRWGVRRLEALVMALVGLVGVCFALELVLLRPDWPSVAAGLIPTPGTLRDGSQLFLAAGILGATVMPHNLYLHSALVRSRRWPDIPRARHWALRFATLDALLALLLAFLVNGAILVLAGGAFHGVHPHPVTDLSQAHHLLTPLLGTSLASVLFGVGLLAAGQSSTLTATLAGQVVMEGFLDLRWPDWQRRLVTRGLALIPAMVTVLAWGEEASHPLLLLSQVVLSLQLPFAVIPLVLFCGRARLMGVILLINGALLASLGSGR